MPHDEDRPEKPDAKAELKRQAREILDRREHDDPAPGKVPLANDDIPEAEHRGNWKAVRGGGEPS